MKLPLKGGLAQTPQDVAQSLERVANAVAAGWNVEHLPNGAHATVSEAVPFAATNFTAAGAMTWMVASGEVTSNRVMQIGTLMRWTVEIYGTTTGGVANSNLRIRIPNNKLARGRQNGTFAWRDAGGTGNGYWVVVDGSNIVQLFKDISLTAWAIGGSAGVAAQFLIEVQ